MTTTSDPTRSRVQSVARAADLLLAFSDLHRELHLSELADAVDLPRSSASRLAQTLVDAGLLEWHGGMYSLGSKLIELGLVADSTHHEQRRAGRAWPRGLRPGRHTQ